MQHNLVKSDQGKPISDLITGESEVTLQNVSITEFVEESLQASIVPFINHLATVSHFCDQAAQLFPWNLCPATEDTAQHLYGGLCKATMLLTLRVLPHTTNHSQVASISLKPRARPRSAVL